MYVPSCAHPHFSYALKQWLLHIVDNGYRGGQCITKLKIPHRERIVAAATDAICRDFLTEPIVALLVIELGAILTDVDV